MKKNAVIYDDEETGKVAASILYSLGGERVGRRRGWNSIPGINTFLIIFNSH